MAVAAQTGPTTFRFNGRVELTEGGSGQLQIHGELNLGVLPPAGTFGYHGRLCV